MWRLLSLQVLAALLAWRHNASRLMAMLFAMRRCEVACGLRLCWREACGASRLMARLACCAEALSILVYMFELSCVVAELNCASLQWAFSHCL
jgi:hypothetical protein